MVSKLAEIILQSQKAIVPLAVGGILSALAWVGVTAQMTVEQAVTLLVTGALVWLVPNKKA